MSLFILEVTTNRPSVAVMVFGGTHHKLQCIDLGHSFCGVYQPHPDNIEFTFLVIAEQVEYLQHTYNVEYALHNNISSFSFCTNASVNMVSRALYCMKNEIKYYFTGNIEYSQCSSSLQFMSVKTDTFEVDVPLWMVRMVESTYMIAVNTYSYDCNNCVLSWNRFNGNPSLYHMGHYPLRRVIILSLLNLPCN